MWDPMYSWELQFKWSFGLFVGVFLKESKKSTIQFGTNNTQNVANLGDNWRKIR